MRESVKHRLIGAAVLAAVAVLFLPSFFKDRQQYQVDTSSHIPGRPSITAVDFNEPEQPEGIEPAPAPETMFVPEDPPVSSLPDEKENAASPVVVSASSAVSLTSQSSSVSSITPPVDQVLPEGWVIQVASLSVQEGANKLRDQLQADGHRAYVRAVPLANTTIYRVFIGPKQNKAEATALKTQLDSRLKVNSLVLPFKP
ncbi:Sporulation related repeat family [Cellvibrio sp. BR]|uniref:SPOR domain-containing protein n=1 Tax=unclassified Cellvibrio TaxID=2624793 RepID=UPI0002601583|nr:MULTISPECIES: SPOR domain-containing protein [unclassified Cellvibrio]EIK45347.1 Sporulation related repeat family [Cellvibrio sp. BR]QEY13390.1 SPOR domain-containing protein [Cellvibrio sp. KY-YJ-3]UUA73267.1 SPOR domain-containing protein [Cellvibrio sp. QJXJ]